MPPIPKVKHEEIVEMAYQIAREEGLEGLNARLLARRLGCSIQPIFHNFHTMEELRAAVIERVGAEYTKYISHGMEEQKKYRGMGMGYLRFARDEPKLFQILFMDRNQQDPWQYMQLDHNYDQIIKVGQKATGLDYETMKKLHFHIWIYTHGIATLLASGTCILSEEELEGMLQISYQGFLSQYRQGEKNEKDN